MGKKWGRRGKKYVGWRRGFLDVLERKERRDGKGWKRREREGEGGRRRERDRRWGSRGIWRFEVGLGRRWRKTRGYF